MINITTYQTKILLTYCGAFLLLVSAAACTTTNNNTVNITPSGSPAASGATAKAPPEDVVRASAAGVEIEAGRSKEVILQLAVAEGYHINANPATYPYLIATKLDVSTEDGITAGNPVYPAPLTRKFAFDPQPLAVYEGQAAIKLSLNVDDSAQKGARNLRARVRVQPCNDVACFPPRTIETSIPVTIN